VPILRPGWIRSVPTRVGAPARLLDVPIHRTSEAAKPRNVPAKPIRPRVAAGTPRVVRHPGTGHWHATPAEIADFRRWRAAKRHVLFLLFLDSLFVELTPGTPRP
jgi:hypothetical protein